MFLPLIFVLLAGPMSGVEFSRMIFHFTLVCTIEIFFKKALVVWARSPLSYIIFTIYQIHGIAYAIISTKELGN